jgi:hypothetical protein
LPYRLKADPPLQHHGWPELQPCYAALLSYPAVSDGLGCRPRVLNPQATRRSFESFGGFWEIK